MLGDVDIVFRINTLGRSCWYRNCFFHGGRSTMKLAIAAFMALSAAGWLNGKPTYIDQPCSKYVCLHAHRPTMDAQQIWDGGNGSLQVVQAQARFEDVLPGSLQEGDILAFHGEHVAVYQRGQFMDSDPRHNGPGAMQYLAGDPWFSGPVRVLRWGN
jgi:hypothetical protein